MKAQSHSLTEIAKDEAHILAFRSGLAHRQKRDMTLLRQRIEDHLSPSCTQPRKTKRIAAPEPV
jgi:hypothetical protein